MFAVRPPSKPETTYASLLGTLNNHPWTLTSLTIKQADIPLRMFGVCKRSNGWAFWGGSLSMANFRYHPAGEELVWTALTRGWICLGDREF